MPRLLPLLLLAIVAVDAAAQVYTRPVFIRRGRFIYVVSRPFGTFPASGAPLVALTGDCRMDWKFAASPGMLEGMPRERPGGFAAAAGDYQLLVPPAFADGKPVGLVLFLGDVTPEQLLGLATACQKAGLALAAPVGMADGVHPGVRLKRAVEVLD